MQRTRHISRSSTGSALSPCLDYSRLLASVAGKTVYTWPIPGWRGWTQLGELTCIQFGI